MITIEPFNLLLNKSKNCLFVKNNLSYRKTGGQYILNVQMHFGYFRFE